MGCKVPKIFMPVNGRAILFHTLDRFVGVPGLNEIVIAISPEWHNHLKKQFTRELKAYDHLKLIEGGPERQQSVRNALLATSADSDVVAVHDAVRPLVARAAIIESVALAYKRGAAIVVQRATATVKTVTAKGRVRKTVPRDQVALAQTPQCFRRAALISAFEKLGDKAVTDDASVIENAGGRVYVVEGNPENVKITVPSDIDYFKAMLDRKIFARLDAREQRCR